MDALVAFAEAVVVTRFCVKFTSVARSISKPVSFDERSVQVRLICDALPAEARSPLGASPPCLIPPPNVATQTSLLSFGLMKTRSTHANGKLATSLKLDDVNPATVTSGV